MSLAALAKAAGLTMLGSAGLLGFGAWTSDRISYERKTLRLPTWPKSLDGLRIGLVADLHLRGDLESRRMAKEAIAWLIEERADMTVIAGDIVHGYRPGVYDHVREALSDLRALDGSVIAVRGNHDLDGPVELDKLAEALAGSGVQLLMNQSIDRLGVCWIGIDSGLGGFAMPFAAIQGANTSLPSVVVWHEGDYVDFLPRGLDLMLSGHSHGGQFRTPWGWPPMTAFGGRKYLDGFFPDTECPLYVSRGLATTGPPSRLFCPAEVSVLTLCSA